MQEAKCHASGCRSHKRKEVGLIMKANRLHRNAIEKRLRALGMHRSQHMLLMLVSCSPDNISQKELAEKLQITPAAVAMTLKKLETGGYISRHIDKTDNRINRTVILPKGAEAVQLSEKSYVEVDNAMLEGISEAELAAFVHTMEKINNNLAVLGMEDSSKLSEKE